ncbi:MAG: peptidyl-prolyl cis-trans isomerase [Pseudomonadota bacterium]
MRLRVLTLCGVLTVVGCARPSVVDPATQVLALVDEQPLYAHELKRVLAGYLQPGQDGASKVAVATALLDEMIGERVLLLEADRQGVQVSREEVTEVLERSAQGYRVRDFQELMHSVYLTPTLLRERVESRLRIERLVQKNVTAPPAFDDAALQAYYDSHLQEFQLPEQVRARQIVVRTREEAEKIREQARKQPFDELARQHSVSPEAERGGDLGLFGRGGMPPVIEDTCFAIKPGEISDVVAGEFGFHLFQVVEARPAETILFEQARDRIAQDLAVEHRQTQASTYIAALKNKAQVVRHLDLLAGIVDSVAPTPHAEEP